MKYQSLVLGNNKKNIINLSSAELVHRVGKVKKSKQLNWGSACENTISTQFHSKTEDTDQGIHSSYLH